MDTSMAFFDKLLTFLFIFSFLVTPRANGKGLIQYVGIKANFPTVDFDVSQLEDETTVETEADNTLGYLSRDPEIVGLFAKVGHFSLELTHNISDDARTADYKNIDFSWHHKRISLRLMLSQIEDFFLNQGEGNIDLDTLEEEDLDHEGFFFQNAAFDVSLV